jgi:hypothetical protein
MGQTERTKVTISNSSAETAFSPGNALFKVRNYARTSWIRVNLDHTDSRTDAKSYKSAPLRA